MTSLPTIVTEAGLQPTPPSQIRANLVQLISAQVPGYTADLPASMIEDMLSTEVASVAQCDSSRVDLVNSLTPYGANQFLLNQLGQIYGVQRGAATNTSVNVVFTGPPGFIVAQGFIVSDGTNQFALQDGGIIASDGNSLPLFAVATLPGIFVVPVGTVTNLVTSVPNTIVLTVTNPQAGIPGTDPETDEQYRTDVLQAGLAVSQGMTTRLRTALQRVPGVQQRLVSVRQVTGGGWQVIVGGGDPQNVANAIFMGLFDISTLEGSDIDPTRDIEVSIDDFPDTYEIIYVNPPQQIVGVALTWNTTLLNFTGDAAIAQYGSPAIQNYINSLFAGQPINVFEMEKAFQEAVEDILPGQLLTRMVFNVTIDGVAAPPIAGTGIIEGDPEGYFFTQATNVSINRG